jgi:hypothetical protein
VVRVSGGRYIRKQVEEGEDRIEALRADLEKNIINYIREQIKKGLDKEFLLQVCSDEDDSRYLRSIFDEEHKTASDKQKKE